MKMLTFFLPVCLIGILPSPALDTTRQTDPLSESLIAHYTFNHCDARDDTGNGNDGILFGDPGCHCGVEDDAILLDGMDDYIEFHGPVNRYFTTSDFTVSFYFKPGKQSVFRQSMLGKRPACDEYTMFDLQLDMTRRDVNTAVYESPEKFFKDLSPDMDKTEWLHFALVMEGRKATTYINGSPRREAWKCSGVDISNESVLSFANSPCLSSGRTVRFKGALDELRIYGRALHEAEIGQLYSLHPVEQAESDCITFVPEILPGQRPPEDIQSNYICAVLSQITNPSFH